MFRGKVGTFLYLYYIEELLLTVMFLDDIYTFPLTLTLMRFFRASRPLRPLAPPIIPLLLTPRFSKT